MPAHTYILIPQNQSPSALPGSLPIPAALEQQSLNLPNAQISKKIRPRHQETTLKSLEAVVNTGQGCKTRDLSKTIQSQTYKRTGGGV